MEASGRFSGELDIASQGQTVETARTNLIEALELFFESADPTEVARRLHSEVFVTRVEVAVERRRLPEDRHVPDPVRGPPWLERSDDGVAERNGSATIRHLRVRKGLGVAKQYCEIKVIRNTVLQYWIGYVRVSPRTIRTPQLERRSN